MFKKLTPNFMVEDVDKAIEFYRDVLGFQVVHTVPGEGITNFAILHEGGVEIMLQAKKSLLEDVKSVGEQDISASIICYLDVDGIQDLYDRIHDKVDVVEPMRKTFYGMNEFYIRDPYGYVLGFAERIK
jgi:uncharacterized glyoxalase superfamily protein PhnB